MLREAREPAHLITRTVWGMGGASEWHSDDHGDDDEDDLLEDAPPVWFPGEHLPDHARRMGLTAHVPDGALLDFAGTLDSTKPLHRFTAWVMLVVFGLPVLFSVLRLFHAFTGG